MSICQLQKEFLIIDKRFWTPNCSPWRVMELGHQINKPGISFIINVFIFHNIWRNIKYLFHISIYDSQNLEQSHWGLYIISLNHSSSSISLTDIYKGWSKSQHIIADTNIVHLTGYLIHVIDNAMAYQVYIKSAAGGNDTVNNQYVRISPCGDCQGTRSSTGSCWIDNHRHPTIDLTVAATAPSSQCRITVNNTQFRTTILRMGVSVITLVYLDEWNV